MSYSFIAPCGDCTKREVCSDRHFIEGAITGIHSVYPPVKGHLGSGTIELNCLNFIKIDK